MWLSIVVSCACIGQVAPLTENSRGGEAGDSGQTTLIVVAHAGRSGSEFLVMRARDDSISWQFIEGKGYTEGGVDPEGEVTKSGVVPGDAKALKEAFKATLGEITDKERPKGPDQRVPARFSLILIDSSGVKTCELVSKAQRVRLVSAIGTKEAFAAAKKKVPFSIRIMMADLLHVETNPFLADPVIPRKDGPGSERPQLPRARLQSEAR